ncbi:phospholipase A1 EG1, chloroplastic/mitochondrial-like [Zingiber officinale]|uniref:phospholipase A1 EG1, chloroplastic/mitochondrial-like n=1 Tax=Zingiber officinale TaxID=94328 RepID=UPI001C4B392E|nr:phospholipase A1 EG1, chloroplastic/mitochondrial-like [Zingiber officinale]
MAHLLPPQIRPHPSNGSITDHLKHRILNDIAMLPKRSNSLVFKPRVRFPHRPSLYMYFKHFLPSTLHLASPSLAGDMATSRLAPASFAPPHRAALPRSSVTSATAVKSRRTPGMVAVTTPQPPHVEKRGAGGLALSDVWREIQGENDWAGMVEPLSPLLRDEIVRYGELVAACYRGFDLDPASGRYLNCKYGKRSLLREVGLPDSGYVVTRYVYATPDATGCSRWIGYVAVASDETVRRLGRRDVLVSFRGTVTQAEWLANFMSALQPARLDPSEPRAEVRVESGFLSLYTSDMSGCRFSEGSCREQLLAEVARLLGEYKEEEEVSVTVAGHSMGSALAMLLGYDLVELGLNRGGEVPVTVYSYGGPRVGNAGFRRRCEKLGLKVLRVANVNDPVTKLPGMFLNEASARRLPWGAGAGAYYTHFGVEVALDFFDVRNYPMCVHDIEAYLSLLKCPRVKKKKKQVVSSNNDADDGVVEVLMKMARRFLEEGRLDVILWRWLEAAMQVSNVVQSLKI